MNNTGDCNTGNWNTGDCNTGNCNTGNWNTGYRNTGDCNTGNFNTETTSKINVFDVECSREDWNNCDKPSFIYFNFTEWICESNMTDKEKEEFPQHKTLGGYLKKYEYKEAFKKSYLKADEEDRKKIFNLPNFNAEKFLEISGIDVNEDLEKASKKEEILRKIEELKKQAEEL